MFRHPVSLTLFLVTVVLLAGCGSDDAAGDAGGGAIRVEQVNVDVPANPDVAAVRLVVDNGTDSDDTLESVTSEVSSTAAIHESKTVNGLATMVPRPSVTVAARSTVTFAPGGLHVMLEGIEEPLAEGDTFTITFHFARSGAVDATAIVVAPGTTDDSEHDHG